MITALKVGILKHYIQSAFIISIEPDGLAVVIVSI